MIKNFENKIIILLLSFIPISMVIGQAISLANIFIVSIFLIIQIIKAKNFNFTSNTTFIMLLIIYAYLLFNIFISLDYSYSFFRNFGFFRLIFLFVAINFLFFKYKNQDIIFNPRNEIFDETAARSNLEPEHWVTQLSGPCHLNPRSRDRS